MSEKLRMKDMEYMVKADVSEIACAMGKTEIMLDVKDEYGEIVFLRKTMVFLHNSTFPVYGASKNNTFILPTLFFMERVMPPTNH